jgi:hypothetical protein
MKLLLLLTPLLLLLLPGCTLTNQHGSLTFHPTPEILKRLGIETRPATLHDK